MTWGSWGKKLTTNEMEDMMHYCLAHQITSFDHADIYGAYTTEADFGNAFAKSGIDRSKIQLITKCGIQYAAESRENRVKHYEYSKEYIIWSAETSLKNLKTDYLDLFLLHRPSPLMQPDEVNEAIVSLQKAGKIKEFGLSNFSPLQSDLIASKTEVSVNQIELSLTASDSMYNGSLDHMTVNNITPMAWSPLGSYFRDNNEQSGRIKKCLQPLTEKYNATEDQLLLAWLAKHPAKIHPVIGTTNKKRIANSVAAMDIDLELQDWFIMLTESQGHKVP
jgi:predicted oxidoreductase